MSVVVPSRGGATRLPILMDALAGQEIDQPWEVVVVLDGDIDNSADVLDSYAARLPLRVINRDTSTGVAAALAAGYAAARGAVVIRCDDDLTPRPDFVARHLAWHHGRPAEAPPLGVIALTRDTFADSAYAEAYGRPANQRLLAAAYSRPAEQRWMHWAACNSVPRAAYDAVGGFDISMTFREDSELGYRLARSGVEIVIDPALEIEHRGPILDVATRSARAFTSGASTRAFDQRHPGQITPPNSRRSLWNQLVSAQARRLGSRDDAARLGRRIDMLLPLTPRPLRGKLVAWAVEASAGAGRREGTVDWARAHESPPAIPASGAGVAIFVPGLSAGGGAEKTALCMATALRDIGLSVTCFTDSAVQSSKLSSHFGLDLTAVEFSILPRAPRLPGFMPQAALDIARDRSHVRALKKLRPDLFINLKYKSALPGVGRRNWYYVHFPHRTDVLAGSRAHGAYLSMIRHLRRAVLHPRAPSFVQTYQDFLANSDFTAGHVLERWGVSATTVHPPCDTGSATAVAPRERILISVGRFQAPGENIPHKNQHVLIEAFRQLSDLMAEGWALHLVGALSESSADRDYHARLLDLAGDLPIDIVANASHRELTELVARASIYWHAQGFGTDAATHPEAQEHFGISTVEAMASGLVPLVYAAGGPLEVVSDVSAELSWTTIPQLVHRTRELAAEESLAALRERCVSRAGDFSDRAFAGRVQQEWFAPSKSPGHDHAATSGRTIRV